MPTAVRRHPLQRMFRLSWKWRERYSVKITEENRVKKTRKHYTPDEKVAVLRRHLLNQEPISKLCDELGLHHGLLPWQKEFFENGAAAFQAKARPNQQPQQQRIEYLEKKIQTKDEVLAELMAEHVL